MKSKEVERIIKMKYVGRLILITEQEAKDNIHDYENSCKTLGNRLPWYWDIMTDQEKIDHMCNGNVLISKCDCEY